MRLRQCLVPLSLCIFFFPVAALNPLWIRDVKISPDGNRIAFSFKGDIYTVSSKGGNAHRLTFGDSYEGNPVWSPDGKKIAFSSDKNGGKDVYIIPADGGASTRITYNSASQIPEAFSPDGKEIYFSALIQDPAKSFSFPYRALSELYAVDVNGGRVRQILPTPAVNISVLPDGKIFYENVKGAEDKWRKHHTSSVTRDIWMFEPSTGKHTNITNHAGEDRNPAVSSDGTILYFLSERNGGSFNIYSLDLSQSGQFPQAVTHFNNHPVRFLSVGKNGGLAFTYNGELYTMLPGQTPEPLKIEIAESDAPATERIRVTNADEAIPSRDGKQLAFTKRGEVFVTATDYPSVKQITYTPASEQGLTWGKDGRTLYYGSLRSGRSNIYKAEIARNEDPNFSNATLINEEPMFTEDGIERNYPSVSPDGKKMAYIARRNQPAILDLATGEEIILNKNITNSRSGFYNLQWSPDSRYIALEFCNPSHEPYSDIAIIDVSSGEFIPLTATGYFDGNPRWSPDGNAIIFASERYGMRNHASWGSEEDVMMIFLNQESYDKFRLSEEDYALLKEVEKQQKKDSSKKQDDNKEKKSKKNNKNVNSEKEEKKINIEISGLQDRIVRLTPNSSTLGDFILSDDGETLYYLSSFEGGFDLWKKDLRKGDVSIVKKLDGRSGTLYADEEGNIFILGNTVKRLNSKASDMKNISINTTMHINPDEERTAMFEYVGNEARERFLLEEMPVDWDYYVNNYRQFLPYINNNYDFADLLSELLGELNVSHSGGRYHPGGSDEPTSSLGLLYDLSRIDKGLKIEEVIAGGPFDRATSKVKSGDRVIAINGKTINEDEDWAKLLNGQTKKKMLVSLQNPQGETWEETILPISISTENELLYNRWVKHNEAVVDSLSEGRLGYVHIQSMSDGSFRTIYSKILGEYIDKEGIVIDTRFNGGGRLHEDIEVLFSGEKYLTQEMHGKISSDMPSRRWNRPSIMIIGEANYSNAHGTPWVYRHKGMGKLVGMPVPGTMSSVNWITLQNPDLVFGIPVTAFRTLDGTILENTQLEPDIRVENTPEDIAKGIDRQLETAVKALLKEL